MRGRSAARWPSVRTERLRSANDRSARSAGVRKRRCGAVLRLPRAAWVVEIRRSPSEASVPVVTLVGPVAATVRLEHTGHAQRREIFRLLVAEFSRHLQADRRAVSAINRLAIHLVTEQRLGMHGARHVDRLVIVVCAFDFDESRVGIGADQSEEVADTRTAEAADRVPTFDADMPRILRDVSQVLYLLDLVLTRMLDRASDGQRPIFQVDAGIILVITVVRKIVEWHYVSIREGGCQARAAEEYAGGPIREAQASVKDPLAHRHRREAAGQHERRELQDLAARLAAKLFCRHRGGSFRNLQVVDPPTRS